MTNFISVPPHIVSICRTLTSHGFRTVAVGGAIRDALLGKEPHDWDVATAATPDEMRLVFGIGGLRSNNGEVHGTVLVMTSAGPVEVTTFRSDVSCDGRNASVAFTRNLTQDLMRRDLTINALAFDPIGFELFGTGENGDPTENLLDITTRTIRFVGNPIDRIFEDRLRVLRAIRFRVAMGGNFATTTHDAIMQSIGDGLLPGPLTMERVRDELIKLLSLDGFSEGIEDWIGFGLMRMFLPEVQALDGLMQNVWHNSDALTHTIMATSQAQVFSPYMVDCGDCQRLELTQAQTDLVALRLTMLLHDVGKSVTVTPGDPEYGNHFYRHEEVGAVMVADICERFKFSGEMARFIIEGTRLHMEVPDESFSDTSIRRWARNNNKMVNFLLDVRFADVNQRNVRDAIFSHDHVVNVLSDTPIVIKLPVSGEDVMRELGIKPGKKVGLVLEAVKNHIDFNPTADRDELLDFIREKGANLEI
jgi:tRNA nucleotidyltransferase (CCA-adding enzyme)